LQYVEQGSAAGTPPVLLLPGMGDSWRSFEPVLARLRPGRHAIAVSQRGHGGSDHPSSGYAPQDYAADVVAFLDAAGVDQAVLVGHSSSALTGRVVAATHPDRVAGLVLIASPLTLVDNAAAIALADEVLAKLEDPVGDDFVDSFVGETVGVPLPDAFLDVVRAESKLVPARVWRETFAAMLAHDGTQGLRTIRAPCLLVWGDDDEIVGRSDQEALRAAMPNAMLRVYDGLGHSPHWEDPGRFTADLEVFLDSGVA
jgi:pimeloyl-ACP methyl ester carboxylesterase